MEYNELGFTKILVSRLCFGALTIGPLQSNLPLKEGAAIIQAALEAGVNFIDTAQFYGTYPYIREALAAYEQKKGGGKKRDIVIASKSYAYTYSEMKKSVEEACRQLGRDYLDIFLMHEQSSRLTLKGHKAALDYLVGAKKEGVVKAIGVSTHNIEVVRAAALIDEIDVIHPIMNIKGLGIGDGSAAEMVQAVTLAHSMGKGIYAMKALGGGHLGHMAGQAFSWLLKKPYIASVAVGMQSLQEVAANTAVFSGQEALEELLSEAFSMPRRLLVESWCCGCGKCADRCSQKAITIKNNTAQVDTSRCILCSYCAPACPDFCLKII